MRKIYSLIVPIIATLILSGISKEIMSQPYPPPLPEQHGYNGTPSPQGAPLDGGTGILLSLGIAYLIMKVDVKKRNTIGQ